MPTKIDSVVEERCVRQMLEHLPEHSSLTAAQARGVGPGTAYLDKRLERGTDRVAALQLLRRRLSEWLVCLTSHDAPNRTWAMDFTKVRTWAGFVYVAFILGVFARQIIAWSIPTSNAVELVDVPLWERNRENNPVVRDGLIDHARCQGANTPRSRSPSTSPTRATSPRSGRLPMPTRRC